MRSKTTPNWAVPQDAGRHDSLGRNQRHWSLGSLIILFALLLIPGVSKAESVDFSFAYAGRDLNAGGTMSINTIGKIKNNHNIELSTFNSVGDVWNKLGLTFAQQDAGGSWTVHKDNGTSGTVGWYNGQGGPRNFGIVGGLHNGDVVTISYVGTLYNEFRNTNEPGEPLTTNTFTITEDNYKLFLGLSRNGYITNININRPDNAPSINGNANTDYNADLLNVNFDEPQFTATPSTAQIIWSSSNPKVAKFRDDATGLHSTTGDVMMINTGITTITATLTVGGHTVTKSYNLTIYAEEAIPTIYNNNQSYGFLNPGKINNREMKVDYFTMEMGDAYGNNNAAIIRDSLTEEPGVDQVGLATTIIDENGWRHAWLSDGNLVDKNGNTVAQYQPYQGTFYKLMPQTDGTLTIKGFIRGGVGSRAVIVEAPNYSTNITGTVAQNQVDGDGFLQSSAYALQDFTFKLKGGKTYYLYGITGADEHPFKDKILNGIWAVFMVKNFTFVSDFQGVQGNKGLIYANGNLKKTDGTVVYQNMQIPLVGAGTSTFDVEVIKVADQSQFAHTTTNTGTIDLSSIITADTKGAYLVKFCRLKDDQTKDLNVSGYFTVTVPYKTHDWDLRLNTTEGVDATAQMNASWHDCVKSNWYYDYKIHSHTKEAPVTYTQLKDPVLCSVKNIDGDNAAYISTTDGLLFTSPTKRFGLTSTHKGWDKYSSVVGTNGAISDHDAINDVYYNMSGVENAEGKKSWFVSMATGSKMIIPALKAGQYVRIYWQHHSGDMRDGNYVYSGDLFKAYNINDLEGTSMDQQTFCNGSGYNEFIVKSDGDVAFEQADASGIGWADVYRVTVGEVGEFLETGLNLRQSSSDPADFATWTGNPTMERLPANGAYGTFSHPQYTLMTTSPASSNFEDNYNCSDGNYGTGDWQLTTSGNIGATINKYGMEYGYSLAPAGSSCNTGNVTASISNNKVTAKGQGTIGIVFNVKSNGFVIDTDTARVAVGVVSKRAYPMTWDFTTTSKYNKMTDLADDAADESNGLWTADGNGGYSLNVHEGYLCEPLFAQGAQLVTRTGGTIDETRGLGIWFDVIKDKDSNGNDRYNTQYSSNGSNKLTITDGYIKFHSAAENHYHLINIPGVGKDMEVYITTEDDEELGVAPSIKSWLVSDATATISKVNETEDGLVSWKIKPANGGDIYVDVTSLRVYKIAVTKTKKSLKAYNGSVYATEAREHNTKYDLNEGFTGNAIKAYTVSAFTKNEDSSVQISTPDALVDDNNPKISVPMAGTLTLNEIGVSPKNTGVILVGEDIADNLTDEPLFVRDINSPEDDTTGNQLTGALTSTAKPAAGNTTPFILTRSFYRLDASGNTVGGKLNGPLAFYRWLSGSINPNTAYLNVPTSEIKSFSANSCISFVVGDEIVDGIEQIELAGDLSEELNSENAEYYSLSGQKLNGKPSQKGIYICNGKKVYVK